jgi:hypothetical protein
MATLPARYHEASGAIKKLPEIREATDNREIIRG